MHMSSDSYWTLVPKQYFCPTVDVLHLSGRNGFPLAPLKSSIAGSNANVFFFNFRVGFVTYPGFHISIALETLRFAFRCVPTAGRLWILLFSLYECLWQGANEKYFRKTKQCCFSLSTTILVTRNIPDLQVSNSGIARNPLVRILLFQLHGWNRMEGKQRDIVRGKMVCHLSAPAYKDFWIWHSDDKLGCGNQKIVLRFGKT